MKLPLSFVVLLSFAVALFAADPSPAADPAVQAAELQFAAGQLKPQSGHIVLHGGLAVADLPSNLRYLSPADTRTVLTKIWGNPDGPDTLGMIVPKDFDPRAAASWAVVMTFEEDGYVKDDDAATIDYTKLLAQMKEGVAEANKEREKQGYRTVDLVGWARPPRYDAQTKKLYWAK